MKKVDLVRFLWKGWFGQIFVKRVIWSDFGEQFDFVRYWWKGWFGHILVKKVDSARFLWKGWFSQILVKRLMWSDFGEKVYLAKFWWKGRAFFRKFKFGLFDLMGFMAYQPLQATQCQSLFIHILNLRFPNKYLVDNISNEPELIQELEGIKLMPHPTYSANQAPLDHYLFLSKVHFLTSQCFNN